MQRHTELKVDYTADRFNSLALTGITADTLIALRRKVYLSAGTLLLYQEVIYAEDILAAFG